MLLDFGFSCLYVWALRSQMYTTMPSVDGIQTLHKLTYIPSPIGGLILIQWHKVQSMVPWLLHLHGQNMAAGVCGRGILSLCYGKGFFCPLRGIDMSYGFRAEVPLSLDFQVIPLWHIMFMTPLQVVWNRFLVSRHHTHTFKKSVHSSQMNDGDKFWETIEHKSVLEDTCLNVQ